MKRQLYFVGLVTIGVFAFSSPGLGRGGGGSHGEMGGHYGGPFGYPGYYRGADNYDFGSYAYRPSPDQLKAARKQINLYLESVQKKRRRPAKQRCVSVVTLPPTKSQRDDYLKKRADAVAKGAHSSSRSVKPEQLQCLMVFDTETNQFVGSGCYVVESLPSKGAVAQFETRTAEFVGG